MSKKPNRINKGRRSIVPGFIPVTLNTGIEARIPSDIMNERDGWQHHGGPTLTGGQAHSMSSKEIAGTDTTLIEMSNGFRTFTNTDDLGAFCLSYLSKQGCQITRDGIILAG